MDKLGFDWKLLLPVFILQLILMVIAVTDLIRSEPARIRGSKWLWAIVIVLGEVLGPVVYFVAGRRNDR
ncbi:PLD nuclease N-terminal domain-containing protein [Gorillibacterium sp. sgz500922]|uniref:PLD nuclease N-terminal domain-containing protein n=1 Tax=Gorillibacterium sp. sgz500922 TaxID=3446694 RepID=UPI003F673573